MRGGWENFKLVATGRWAVSFIGFGITMPFGVLISIERELTLNQAGDFNQAFLTVSSGYFITMLYLFILQSTILKKRSQRAVPVFICILSWYSSGAVLGFSTALYAKLAFESDWQIFQRMVAPFFFTGTALALTAYYLGTIGRLREEAIAFDTLEAMVMTDSQNLEFSVNENHKNISALFKTLVRPGVLNIINSLSEIQKSGRLNNLTTELDKIKEQSLKLIRTLDQGGTSQSSEKYEFPDSSRLKNYENSLISVIFPRLISVRISVYVMALGATVGQFPRNGIQGVAAGLTGSVLIGCGLFILSRFYRMSTVQSHGGLRFSFFFLAFIFQVIWTYMQPIVGFNLENPYNPWYSAAKTIYGVYVASIIASLIVINAERKNLYAERVNNLSRELEQKGIELKDLGKKVLEVRYGTLLGKIGSISLAINLLSSIKDAGQTSIDILKVLQQASDLLSDSLALLAGLIDEPST